MAKKILVIDDSALMRRVISDIINESNEYEVAAIAKDGVEGFDMIVSNPNLYSAIILDINMPKMNGLELLRNLQKKQELWQYIKEKDRGLFFRLRYGVLGNSMNLPGKGGRKISVEGYKLCQRFFKFN